MYVLNIDICPRECNIMGTFNVDLFKYVYKR